MYYERRWTDETYASTAKKLKEVRDELVAMFVDSLCNGVNTFSNMDSGEQSILIRSAVLRGTGSLIVGSGCYDVTEDL